MFEPDPSYPATGTLEEKALFSLEQLRQQFYFHKKIYNEQKEGGSRHTAVLISRGVNEAARMAKETEAGFRNYIAQAYLDEDGNTTDAKYPVDKMVNHELRRIRAQIILAVSQFFYQIESMLPEELDKWSEDNLFLTLDSYRHRYVNDLHESINILVTKDKLPPRTNHELFVFLEGLAKRYKFPDPRAGSRDYLIRQMRDELIVFLLQDIPFNNAALEGKPEVIPGDDKVKPATLH